MIQFQKATKTRSKLRLALIGPAGSGKTYSALAMAGVLGEKVAVMDTERGSASLYADLFEFDVVEPDSFAPQSYVDVIRAAEQAGYDVLVIDSLSHAWAGKDGALEMVDKAAARSKSSNSFAAWRQVTPHHNAMVDALIGANLHIIGTLRSKTEYVQEKDDRGKTIIRKVGLQPVQRDGLEYEFTVVGDIDQDHVLAITKTRCPVVEGAVIEKPGPDLAQTLLDWLSDGQEDPVAGLREQVRDLVSQLVGPNVKLQNGEGRKVAAARNLADQPGARRDRLEAAITYLEGVVADSVRTAQDAIADEVAEQDAELPFEDSRRDLAPNAIEEGH